MFVCFFFNQIATSKFDAYLAMENAVNTLKEITSLSQLLLNVPMSVISLN